MYELAIMVFGTFIVAFILYKLYQFLSPNCVLLSDIDYNGLQCSIVGIGNDGYTVYLQLSDDQIVAIDGFYGHYKVTGIVKDVQLSKVKPVVKFADYLNVLSTIHEDRYETTYYQLNHILERKDFN